MAVVEAGRVTTADELIRLPTGMGKRYELVRGELKTMSPAGSRHGEVALQAGSILHGHVRRHKLGRTFGAETGFILGRNPETVRAPDVAFVSTARLPKEGVPEKYFPGAPDLAVEVVSPDDRADEIQQKVTDYLQAGAQAVWVLYPKTRSVAVHLPGGESRTLKADDILDGGTVVPGFQCKVSEFFD